MITMIYKLIPIQPGSITGDCWSSCTVHDLHTLGQLQLWREMLASSRHKAHQRLVATSLGKNCGGQRNAGKAARKEHSPGQKDVGSNPDSGSIFLPKIKSVNDLLGNRLAWEGLSLDMK